MRGRLIASGLLVAMALGAGWVAYVDDIGWLKSEEPPRELTAISPRPAPDVSASFTLCAGPVRVNCVVDGDTFWFNGEKIRIADIDAPELLQPRCPQEKQAGEAARDRLLTLLNAGRFSLDPVRRDQDSYGRKLRNIMRGGTSVGELLVEEGLARRWAGPRWGWCER